MKTGFIVFTVRGTEVSVLSMQYPRKSSKNEEANKRVCTPPARRVAASNVRGTYYSFWGFLLRVVDRFEFCRLPVVGPGAAVAVIDAVNRRFLKPSRTQTKCFPR